MDNVQQNGECVHTVTAISLQHSFSAVAELLELPQLVLGSQKWTPVKVELLTTNWILDPANLVFGHYWQI